jgi:hypothetical protein
MPHRPSTKAMRSKYATNSVIEIVENPLAAQSSNIHARTDERGILFNSEFGRAVIDHQKKLMLPVVLIATQHDRLERTSSESIKGNFPRVISHDQWVRKPVLPARGEACTT